jgi:hypothetical protein
MLALTVLFFLSPPTIADRSRAHWESAGGRKSGLLKVIAQSDFRLAVQGPLLFANFINMRKFWTTFLLRGKFWYCVFHHYNYALQHSVALEGLRTEWFRIASAGCCGKPYADVRAARAASAKQPLGFQAAGSF